ncbi:hypothetical protein BDV30DRAFT_215888 [Aspergillus minisclerotigenes]|uniref:Uncharacterized protein n=1 Tax=Aspergillus minisclerotigenes TaxID=656917 RepID=A0A5N6IUU5_9EURO|nr:hypothetical protein BDV30DRAFT_215888 [Aspergillus minisclerotigenes]
MNAHVSMKPELVANHLGRRLSIPIVCSQWLTNQKWERERVPLDSSKFRSTTAGFICLLLMNLSNVHSIQGTL